MDQLELQRASKDPTLRPKIVGEGITTLLNPKVLNSIIPKLLKPQQLQTLMLLLLHVGV